LGQSPQTLKAVSYGTDGIEATPTSAAVRRAPLKKDLVGVDVFLHWREGTPEQLGALVKGANVATLTLQMITNRGVKVYPNGLPETFCTDHWRCRFINTSGTITHTEIIALLQRIDALKLDFIKSENLCNFDGVPGFAMGQGQ